MTSLEQKYAACNGAYLEFYDGHRSGLTASSAADVLFLAFLTEFSQNYSLSYDQEEVIGRNDPIMSYRGTKRTLSLAWDLPANDLFDAKANKIKTRMLMRLLYPEYRNNYTVKKKSSLTKAEKEKLKEMGRQNLIEQSLSPGTEGPMNSFNQYLRLIGLAAFNNSSNIAQVNPTSQFQFSDTKHTQTMIKNPLIGIKYANLITSSFIYPDDPLLGWIDNLTITPQLDAGFFTQKPGVLADLLTEEQLSAAGPAATKALKTVEEGGSFPKVYSLSCNFNVIHDKPMGWHGGVGGLGTPY